MVARGHGGSPTCWGSAGSGDCRATMLNSNQHHFTGVTARLSDAKINSLTYSRIRFSGTNFVTGTQYWRGKDDSAGGCTYRHRRTAAGLCNCASLNLNMSPLRCGRTHGGHQGVGDWPNPSGGLHSMHTGNMWCN